MARTRELAAQRERPPSRQKEQGKQTSGIKRPHEYADQKSSRSLRNATSLQQPHMKEAKPRGQQVAAQTRRSQAPLRGQEKSSYGTAPLRRSARLSNAPWRQPTPKHADPVYSQLSPKSVSQEHQEAVLQRGRRKRSHIVEDVPEISHEPKRQRTSPGHTASEDTLPPVDGSPKLGSRPHKRPSCLKDPVPSAADDRPRKRRRTSPDPAVEVASIQEAVCGDTQHRADPIDFWTREGHWPKEYFEQDDFTRKIFEESESEDSWLKEMDPTTRFLFAKKKALTSLGRKRSGSDSSMNPPSSVTPSDQKPREEKSAPYRDAKYPFVLQTKGVFMKESNHGISEASIHLCQKLLDGEQELPKQSLFDDAVFKTACQNLEGKNEARVIQDISRLIVPSVETLALRTKALEHLTESVNEGWNNSIPLTGTRPQPDYSAGFKREAFTEDQLAKLAPFVGDWISGDLSFFMATYYMYFPFLTCEVKCGAAALDVADRQNAHSMTLAVRAIVELFRLLKREKELHREILAFSVSHDHRSVRIYGYYPVVDGKDTKYYRHPIHEFSITALDGREKWTAYRFTKNILDLWVPDYFKRICSAIDELPSEVDFEVPPLPETGLSQSLQSSHLSQLETDFAAASEQGRSDPEQLQAVTPAPSSTGPGAREKAKRPKKKQP